MPEDPTMDQAADLLSFIGESPSPFHVVAEATRRLTAAGFSEAREADAWPSGPGRHFVVRDAAMIAWSGDPGPARGFRIVGAHTDSPNLRVKPRPEVVSGGWRQVGIEVYGGALWNSWLDRDLGLSGRVTLAGPGGPTVRLFRDDRAVLRIPQIAIHLDREVNQVGLRLDPQRHLTPVWGLEPPGATGRRWFAAYVADLVGGDPADVLTWDAMVHDVQPGTLAGVGSEFVSAARLDDQLSCWAGVRALTTAGHDGVATGAGQGTVAVLALFDHEEVGSQSRSGASGDLLAGTLERIVMAAGGDRSDYLRAIAASSMVSADGAHATHPNHPDRHDPHHAIALNAGPVIKHNSNMRYATDAATAAEFELICRGAGVAVQHFVSRNDIACGSTIGPATSARTGIPTVDVGVAQLAMHSARELCGSADPALLVRALRAFLTSG